MKLNNTIAIQLENSKGLQRYSSTYGIRGNEINLSGKNTYAVNGTIAENLVINTNTITLNSENATAISLNQIENLTINMNTININATDSKVILIQNTNQTKIQLNTIESISENNLNKSAISLVNSSNTTIDRNNIVTTNTYTIILDENSRENIVTNNTLFTQEYIADATVKKYNDINRIRYNNPVKISNIFLNEETYHDFFYENGTLREEVPENITVLVTSNLHNRILNITKPLNIIANGITFKNTKIILDQNASKTNLKLMSLTGDSELIINSNDCNINIESIDLITNRNENITPIIVNGNNNTIQILSAITIITENKQANLTVITITKNKNIIELKGYLQPSGFNNVTNLLLNNAENNNITLSYTSTTADIVNNVILNNSNKNILSFNQLSGGDVNNITYMLMDNSSYNTILGWFSGSRKSEHTRVLYLKNHSDNNRIKLQCRINGFSFSQTPILVEDSYNNSFIGGEYYFDEYEGYAMEFINSEANTVEYNIIKTKTRESDDGVLQQNTVDIPLNMVRYNMLTRGKKTSIALDVPLSAKINQTITINVTPTTNSGMITVMINNKEYQTLNITNQTMTINYTIHNSGDLFIEVIYKDPTLVNYISFNNTTVEVQKLDTIILLPDVVNNGAQSTITAIVLDENGKIITNGKVAFKLNGKTLKVVNIRNGVATTTINTDTYSLKNYTITAVYGGSDVYHKNTQNAILTLQKFNINLSISEVSLNDKKATFKVNVSDLNGIKIETGKVSFKLNDRTIKDSKGNVIYANIKNGLAILTCDISDKVPKNYNLTSIMTVKGDKYNATTEITIPKTTPKLSLITGNVKRSNNSKISVKIADSNNNPIKVKTKVVLKFNKKTIQTVETIDGNVDFILDLTDFKNSNYNIELVVGENKFYNKTTLTSKLTVE